ncbi:MAG: sigma 54-interacting transcriptional regulator [Leptospiraceae bacterium]|nr:sigma 54-interacting transcriptional regulator [Leptospiraceae bacterium]
MQWIHLVLVTRSISLGLSFALLIAVLWQRPRRTGHWALVVFLIGSISYFVANALSEFLTLAGRDATRSGQVAGFAIQLLAITTYFLCDGLPARAQLPARAVRFGALSLITLLVCPLILSHDWISGRRRVADYTTATYGDYYVLTSGWATALVLAGLATLVWKLSREHDPRLRQHLRLFLVGSTISFLCAFVLSFVLPLLGNDKFLFLGIDLVIVFLGLLTYAILNHRMFDLGTAVLRYGLRFILSVAVSTVFYFFFLVWILDRQVSDFSWELAITLSLFFLAAVVFARRVLPVIDRALFRRLPPAESVIIELFEKSPDDAPMSRVQADIFAVLSRAVRFRAGVFIAADHAHRYWVLSHRTEMEFGPTARRLYDRLLRVERLPLPILKVFDRSILLEQGEPVEGANTGSARYRRILSVLGESIATLRSAGFQVLMPLVYGARLCGLIALAAKEDDLPYFEQEIEFLDALRLNIGILLGYRRKIDRAEFMADESQQDLDRLTDLISSGRIKVKPVTGKSILYRSARMERCLVDVEKFASRPGPVLITGETGTGKELIARLLHRSSSVASEPFVAINCASVPENLWEDELYGHVRGAFTDARQNRSGRIREAGGGTLFLDEIGEIPLEMQGRLLRVLQERKYSPVGSDDTLDVACRFVFATHRNLELMIREGAFREDLYYRINVFAVHVPALRERAEDIPALLEHFLKEARDQFSGRLERIAPAALQALVRYQWPGNVRELENFVIRAGALAEAEELRPGDLPASIRSSGTRLNETQASPGSEYAGLTLREMIDQYTRRVIEEALRQTDGNRTHAAQRLGLKRGALLYRMKELGIE